MIEKGGRGEWRESQRWESGIGTFKEAALLRGDGRRVCELADVKGRTDGHWVEGGGWSTYR